MSNDKPSREGDQDISKASLTSGGKTKHIDQPTDCEFLPFSKLHVPRLDVGKRKKSLSEDLGAKYARFGEENYPLNRYDPFFTRASYKYYVDKDDTFFFRGGRSSPTPQYLLDDYRQVFEKEEHKTIGKDNAKTQVEQAFELAKKANLKAKIKRKFKEQSEKIEKLQAELELRNDKERENEYLRQRLELYDQHYIPKKRDADEKLGAGLIDIQEMCQEEEDGKSERPQENLFKKPLDNCFSQLTLMEFERTMQSIGALTYYNDLLGTIFRVGQKYVMTAAHCLSPVVDPLGTGRMDTQKLSSSDVKINFGPSRMTVENPIKIVGLTFSDRDLDFAVLEISNENVLTKIPALKLCRENPSFMHVPTVNILGYGHPTVNKVADFGCKVLHPTDPDITRAKSWFQKDESRLRNARKTPARDTTKLAYEGYDQPEKILFSCFLEHGSSGAPIVTTMDPQQHLVIGFITHGLPHCLWDLNAAYRSSIPLKYRFEAGTRMSAVYNSINSKDPRLAQELFD